MVETCFFCVPTAYAQLGLLSTKSDLQKVNLALYRNFAHSWARGTTVGTFPHPLAGLFDEAEPRGGFGG